MKRENDPDLHSVDGIAEALDEAQGEMGIAVEYGAVLLGRIHAPKRELSPHAPIPRIPADFKPFGHDSDYIELWAAISLNERDLVEYLRADAARNLKPGQRFEIRKRAPSNFGRTHGMAWYRNDAMDAREDWGRSEGEYVTPGSIEDRRVPRYPDGCDCEIVGR